MDAHSFRILSSALIPLLYSARIDKIYGPLPDLTVFHCFGKIGKFALALQTQRQQPRYFLQSSPLPNPQNPTPAVMRLRKYLINAHFGEAIPEFSTRSLALPIIRRGEIAHWLVCSPAQGITLTAELPENFPAPLTWPDQETLRELHAPQQLDAPATWLAYPTLTPLLRKTISALDFPEAMALMVDLEAGGGELFFYGPVPSDKTSSDNLSGKPSHYFAWPLPDSLCEEQGLEFIETNSLASLAHFPRTGDNAVPLALQLASFVDEQELHASFSKHITKDDKQDSKRILKRARRKERALEQEALRLEKMVNRQQDAKLIQENLWRLDPNAKYDHITLNATLPSGKIETRTVSLDPRLTIRDNMLEIFKKAEKGKRGLAIVATRQQEHLSPHPSSAPITQGNTIPIAPEKKTELSSLQNWASLIEQDKKCPQKTVAYFTSSDGYTLLRGKNAQGNRQILKLSKGHDIWLHAQEGPSAHVIIKRHHAQDQVPEKTIIEAAQLVAEKSWLKESDAAEIMMAFVKNVQPIKGAAAGTVKVEKTLPSVYIKKPE